MTDKKYTYKWKIVIIAQYSDKWKYEYKELVGDIQKSLFTDSIRFCLFTYNVPKIRSHKGTVVITDYYKEVLNDPLVYEWGKSDFYDGVHIKKFFKEIVLPVSSEKLALITWGHGMGLGYLQTPEDIYALKGTRWFKHLFEKHIPFSEENSVDIKLASTIQFLKANLSKSFSVSPLSELNLLMKSENFKFKDLLEPVQPDDVISAESLAEWLGILKQQVAIFISSNCYCQMFETGYSLRNVVKLMIAAQTTYPLAGFDYLSFFSALQLEEPKEEKDLASDIVNNFPKKYTQEYIESVKIEYPEFDVKLEAISISANDLSYYDNLLGVINSLASLLITKLNGSNPDYINFVDNSRSECEDMAPREKHGIIDLIHYVEKLLYKTKAVPDKALEDILNKLQEINKVCNKAILKPPQLYKPIEDPNESENPEFLSIYFPFPADYPVQAILYRAFYTQNIGGITGLQKVSTWDDFVRIYVRKSLSNP